MWDSGIGLSSWLVRLSSAEQTETTPLLSELRQSLLEGKDRNIIELGETIVFNLEHYVIPPLCVGAGTGIVAITLSILRSKLDTSENLGRILTTDLRESTSH